MNVFFIVSCIRSGSTAVQKVCHAASNCWCDNEVLPDIKAVIWHLQNNPWYDPKGWIDNILRPHIKKQLSRKKGATIYGLKEPAIGPLMPLTYTLTYGNAVKQASYLGKGKRVLDLACGNGLMNGKTYQQLGYEYIDQDHTIFGCDILDNPYFEGEFFKCNAENLAFTDDFFDGVVCMFSLDHFLNPVKAFEEVHRVLKSGGMFFIAQSIFHGRPHLVDSDHRHHMYYYSIKVMELLYRKVGFGDLEYYCADNAGINHFFKGFKG